MESEITHVIEKLLYALNDIINLTYFACSTVFSIIRKEIYLHINIMVEVFTINKYNSSYSSRVVQTLFMPGTFSVHVRWRTFIIR